MSHIRIRADTKLRFAGSPPASHFARWLRHRAQRRTPPRTTATGEAGPQIAWCGHPRRAHPDRVREPLRALWRRRLPSSCVGNRRAPPVEYTTVGVAPHALPRALVADLLRRVRHPFHHLVRCDLLLVRRHLPNRTRGIGDHRPAIAPKHVAHRRKHLGPG